MKLRKMQILHSIAKMSPESSEAETLEVSSKTIKRYEQSEEVYPEKWGGVRLLEAVENWHMKNMSAEEKRLVHTGYHISHLIEKSQRTCNYGPLYTALASVIYEYLDKVPRNDSTHFRIALNHWLGCKAIFMALYHKIFDNEKRFFELRLKYVEVACEQLPNRHELFAKLCFAARAGYESYKMVDQERFHENGMVLALVGQGLTSAIHMANTKPEKNCPSYSIGENAMHCVLEEAIMATDRLAMLFGASVPLYFSGLEFACGLKSESHAARFASNLREIEPSFSDTYSGADMPKHVCLREDSAFDWFLNESKAARKFRNDPFKTKKPKKEDFK